MTESLQEALVSAGGPVLAGLVGMAARAINVPTPVPPLPATVTASAPPGGPLAGDVALTISAGGSDVSIALDTASLEVPSPLGATWEGLASSAPAHLSGAPGTVLSFAPGTSAWTLSNEAQLHLDSPALLVSCGGTTGATLRIAPTSLSLGVDADGPTIAIAGTVELRNVPGLTNATGQLALSWSSRGWSGSAVGNSSEIRWSLGWSGHDVVPASVDVSVPLHLTLPAALPFAVAVGDGARMRVTGARTATGLDVRVQVESNEAGVVSSDDAAAAAAVVFGTACAANQNAATAKGGAALGGIAATAAALISGPGTPISHATGQAVVSRAMVDLQDPGSVTVDYEASLSATIGAGLISVATSTPLHVGVRGARFRTDDLSLDLRAAQLDLTDNGTWTVTSPAGVLDVAAVRSGFGSSWFELDLRFGLDLGPIRVDGATLRVDLSSGAPSLRGFGVSIDVPGLVHGSGAFSISGGAFTASASLVVDPLQLTASAGLLLDPSQGFVSTVVAADVGLPVPLPLANSGFGLMEVNGVVGIRRRPVLGGSSLNDELHWNPLDPASTAPDAAGQLFGAGITVGTLPDLGTVLRATGNVIVAAPDLAVRAALDATVLRVGLPHLQGVLTIDRTGVFVGVEGQVTFPESGFTLLQARLPVEAWFPVGSNGWHVYLGTDGEAGRTSPGPVSFTVLPDLFGVRCEAFLMVAGDGLTNVLGRLPDLPGFAIATGFRFSTTYGPAPLVYADIAVEAAVGVGTAPLVVAGSGHAGGSLHLGPFSLGFDVDVDLQVGPGADRWAHLEACGSIDLFFTDISGCVHIDLGQRTVPTPDPPGGPLSFARGADPWGRSGTSDLTLNQDPAQAPTVWPDATIVLGFSPAPTPQLATSTFAGLSCDAPDGVGGCVGAYETHHTLTGLDLNRISGTTKTPAGANLPARWQTAVSTSSAQGAARILSLLTTNPAQWATGLPDGGAGSPVDPVQRPRNDCHGLWRPDPGWALGADAEWLGPALHHIPPDHPAGGPLASVIEARVSTTVQWGGQDVPVDPLWVQSLPPASLPSPGDVERQGAVALPTGEQAPGWLRLPALELIGKEPIVAARTVIGLSDALVPASSPGDLAPTLIVITAPGVGPGLVAATPGWTAQPVPGPAGLEVTALTWTGGPIDQIVLDHPIARGQDAPTIGVVAIGGCTKAAADAAVAANTAGRAADQAAGVTPTTASTVLAPGTLHELDIAWEAYADRKGVKSATSSGEQHAWYFRTAAHADSEPAFDHLRTAVDVFHPAMLVRYLVAYDPDGDQLWFVDDPVSVTFATTTTVAVAAAYGYELRLEVRRTDPAPGSHPGPVTATPQWQRTARLDLLTPLERRGRAVLGDGCGWPSGAITGTAQVGFDTSAAYDLSVVCAPSGAVPAPDHRIATSLPPVAFRTSRWPSPASQFEALGFGANASLLHALLPAGAAPPAAPTASDAALEAALAAVGLSLPPLTTPARTTLLWSAGSPSAVAGVLVESDEALERGARVGALQLEHPSGPVTPTFDRSRTTALFWPSAPFPSDVLTLRWGEHQSDPTQPTSPWTSAGAATLTVAPSPAIDALALEVTA
ncbi:MAG: hypothetical protein JO086_06295 [Acidimicrobiia bacterium]|nr:hypothetical protein [Acidimicrobiia bacterium]